MFERNDLTKSREETDAAIAQGTKLAGAYSLRGDLFLAAKANRSALESYEEALRLASPNDEGVPALRERVAALLTYIEFGDHTKDAAYIRPVLLNTPMPRYTDDARQNKVQGSVKLAVLVDERGGVSSTLIFSRLGYGLDEEAIRAARTLRFKPASKDGKPVPFWLQVEVEFNLK